MAIEVRERRPGYHVEIIPVVIGCMRECANRRLEQIARVLETGKKKMTRTWEEMLKTVLAKSESMI